MKVFTVYKHESKGYEAVKVGWSWPGFFFGPWWMLVKGFLFLFIFYITAYGLTSIYYYDSDINAPFIANDIIVLIIILIHHFIMFSLESFTIDQIKVVIKKTFYTSLLSLIFCSTLIYLLAQNER